MVKTQGEAEVLAQYVIKNPFPADEPRAAEHRIALESLSIVANELTPAATVAAAPATPATPATPDAPATPAAPAPPPPAATDAQVGGCQRDAREEITRLRVEKRRQQRA